MKRNVIHNGLSLLGMKRYNCHICGLLIVALACFTFSGCQTSSTGASGSTASMAAPSKNAGRLTIRRAANFGDNFVLNVSIDGASVASLVRGRSYHGTLSPGQHVISLNVAPSLGSTTKRLTVQAGQTYAFTAMWSGQRSVRVRRRSGRLRCDERPPARPAHAQPGGW